MPPHQLTRDDLYNVEDIGLWRKITELYSCNDRLGSDGEVQKTAPVLALNSYDAVTNKKQAQEHAQNPDMREN